MLQFRNDPALGIVYLVLGIREAGSPAMHRGTAVDEAIGSLLTQSIDPDLDQLKRAAAKKYRALIAPGPASLPRSVRSVDAFVGATFRISEGNLSTNRRYRGSGSGLHRPALSE